MPTLEQTILNKLKEVAVEVAVAAVREGEIEKIRIFQGVTKGLDMAGQVVHQAFSGNIAVDDMELNDFEEIRDEKPVAKKAVKRKPRK